MRINTASSVPEFLNAHAKLLFWAVCLFSVLFFTAGIYAERPTWFFIPFTALFALLAFVNFRAVFYLLLIVLPLSVESYIGTLGIDLPSEPIVIMLAGCTLLYLVLNKQEVSKPAFCHPVFILLMLQLAWTIFSAVFSTDVALSIKYILAKSWYLLGFFVLPLIMLRTKNAIRNFFWCLFIPTLFSILFILVKHATLKFTFDNIQNAVYPIYRNHVNYAVFITMMLPLLFMAKNWYPVHYVRHKIIRYSIPVFLAGIGFSYTRGAWLAVGVMLGWYIVLRLRLTRLMLVVSGIAVIAFSVYILKDNNYLKYSPDFEHTIYHEDLSEHLTSTFEMQDMSTVERFYRWIAAVKLFQDHPVVGVGPNNFVTNYKKYTVSAYETYISDNEERSTVHNYFLLLLTEQGLPALLIFVALIVVVLITGQRAFDKASATGKFFVMPVILCIVAFLLNNTLSDLVEANKVGSLFFMCLAMLVNMSSGEDLPDQ